MEKEFQAAEGQLKKMDAELRAALTKLEKEEAAVENLTREVDQTANVWNELDSHLEHLNNTKDESKTSRKEFALKKKVVSERKAKLRIEQNNLALS